MSEGILAPSFKTYATTGIHMVDIPKIDLKAKWVRKTRDFAIALNGVGEGITRIVVMINRVAIAGLASKPKF